MGTLPPRALERAAKVRLRSFWSASSGEPDDARPCTARTIWSVSRPGAPKCGERGTTRGFRSPLRVRHAARPSGHRRRLSAAEGALGLPSGMLQRSVPKSYDLLGVRQAPRKRARAMYWAETARAQHAFGRARGVFRLLCGGPRVKCDGAECWLTGQGVLVTTVITTAR